MPLVTTSSHGCVAWGCRCGEAVWLDWVGGVFTFASPPASMPPPLLTLFERGIRASSWFAVLPLTAVSVSSRTVAASARFA